MVATGSTTGVPRGSGGSPGFGDRVAERVAARGSQLVVGLDPDPARLWNRSPVTKSTLPAGSRPADQEEPPSMAAQIASRAARAVRAHCEMVLDAVAEHCVAAKPQVACFERLGAPGWLALAEVTQLAGERGLLVIADAKRGDIDVSAAAYGQAYFGGTVTEYGIVPGLGADALTASPLLGADSLAPLIQAARAGGGGVFVLVRTSNLGAADVQELPLAGGETVSERLARLVDDLGKPGIGGSGLSDVGAVVGATASGSLAALRELMPSAVFLLPGVGAQGGRVEELGAAFTPGRGGGLVAVSRGIVSAHERQGGDPAPAAAEEAARLRELAWSISG